MTCCAVQVEILRILRMIYYSLILINTIRPYGKEYIYDLCLLNRKLTGFQQQSCRILYAVYIRNEFAAQDFDHLTFCAQNYLDKVLLAATKFLVLRQQYLHLLSLIDMAYRTLKCGSTHIETC